MATTATQAHKNRLKHNVQNLDEQYPWYLVKNPAIELFQKERKISFDFQNREKAHPILVIGVFTSTPQSRISCVVRSSSRSTSIEHYEHTKCVRTCKLNLNGFLDDKFIWSVPENQCNSNTYSCHEPSNSYVLDDIEEKFTWFQ
jgi:hypothetical protein